ncbi:tail tubular protein B [Roseobacter phage CRP-804]|uniref:Tail tubular protein B n=1 Tax=Roseobacter phage CRP-804 TaxID=3072850 RepID=A0AAX3ZVL7_9CAUD|nr:tail tubular protein B [Roseobacter phage CRP-804]
MPLVSTSISNLISGVSQQPAPQRLRTSCEEMINAYPSVVAGLQKRPPTEFIAAMNSNVADDDTTSIHIINRDFDERYIVVGGSGDLEVFEVDGTKKTVNFPDGKSYLPTTDMWKKLRFVTVADTTFVLNTEKVVGTNLITETRANPSATASVFIKRAVASTTYAVYVNGVLAAETATNDNTTAGTALEGTADIANELKTNAISKGYADAKTYGPLLTFTVPLGATIEVLDQFGGNAMEAYTDRVQSFDKLPPSEAQGRLVQIKGNLNDATEDYWVEYENGVWIETVAYDAQEELNPATMPHVLIREADGTFTFKQHTWSERTVGDADTNPNPTFVDRKINSMFLFKGRLGFLSEENVVMSAVGELESLYRTTVVQVFNSDRIDVASITGRVNNLYHAAIFSDTLVLFSDSQQFKLTSQEVLSPTSVGIVPSTKFACSPYTSPVASGPIVYFVTDGSTNSTVRELYIDDELKTIDADDITVQIPSYIPNEVRTMAVSTYDDVMVCLSALEPSKMYVYKWYTSGGEKVQTAWGTWDFGDSVKIMGAGFLEDFLYVVYKMGGEMYLDRMFLDTKPVDKALLDHRVESSQLTVTWNATDNRTEIVLPYSTPATLEFYKMQNPKGQKLTLTKVDDQTYHLAELDATTWDINAGIPYNFEYIFSPQYIRESTPTGEAAIQEGRIQLRYMSLVYMDTSFFKVRVTPTNNKTFEHLFNARIFADKDNIAGVMPRDTGEFRFPVFAQNDRVEIKIINDSAFPCAFGPMEWTGMYIGKTQRL